MKNLFLLTTFLVIFFGAQASAEDLKPQPTPAVLEGVLATLVEQPPTSIELDIETPEARIKRLTLVRDSLVAVTTNRRDLAAAITIGHGETTFAWYTRDACSWHPPKWTIRNGDCDRRNKRSKKPDAGKVQARSYWQLWKRTCPELWASVVGSDVAVRFGAMCAIRHWRFGFKRCYSRKDENGHRLGWVGAFSGYRGGAAGCNFKNEKRVARFKVIRAQLGRNIWKAKKRLANLAVQE